MKLSIIEPFAAKLATDEHTEELITDLGAVEPKVEAVATEEGNKTLADSSEDEVRRGLARFVDFVAEKRVKKSKPSFSEKHRAKIITIYRKQQEMEISLDLRGNRYNEVI